MELFAPLDPEEVDELGDRMYLELPQSETARIRKDYQSPTQRKEAYLDLYVHQHPCPTRNDVAEVLFNCANLRQQADLVENTYVKGTQDTVLRLLAVSIISTAWVTIGSPVYCFMYPPCHC